MKSTLTFVTFRHHIYRLVDVGEYEQITLQEFRDLASLARQCGEKMTCRPAAGKEKELLEILQTREQENLAHATELHHLREMKPIIDVWRRVSLARMA